jgi:hypothetical protein
MLILYLHFIHRLGATAMPILSQKEKLHLLVVRDARKPVVFEVSDITPTMLEQGVVVYGSQSFSGDYNPYFFVYKDIVNIYHVIKFTQIEASEVFQTRYAEEALFKAQTHSEEALSITNTAVKSLGGVPMSLKALSCKV